MIGKFRRLLIRIGKTLPFVICFLVCIHYMETAFSLATSDFLVYDGMVIPNTRISFFVGRCFEYNIQALAILTIISIAIETCIYNKLACLYLAINLIEKSYFSNVELYPEHIYAICAINILVCIALVVKGSKIATK